MRWIIGDIHGMLRPLRTLIEAVRNKDTDPRFIFAGDYVNRGSDAKGVIELLLSLKNAFFIRGNHDDIFDQVLHNVCYAENATRGDRLAAFVWFMKYGLDSTLFSYGIDVSFLYKAVDDPTSEKLQRIVEWVPQNHRDFIRNLLPAYEDDDLFVVHGKWDPDEMTTKPGITARLEADPGLRHRLLWGRFTEDEINRTKAWGRTGFFGHTPVSNYNASYRTPGGLLRGNVDRPNMIPVTGKAIVLLDTAAALGEDGRLTAYCPDTKSYLQTDHFGALVKQD